ncbi:CRISPR-associated ring nuclease Csm6 [Vibrio casei]|uniref:CRISPR-associated ring nuclease Csm6 n=1 Tax=Vibrio casei TaxID=673372 RepID=UPI000DA6AED3|nr:CRISPR-associated ring nuclease Csm6 [Vibrio casei]
MKKILLAIVGSKPQVLTEVIYGLYQSGQTLPDEIRVITTRSTRDKITSQLFKEGYWQSLINEYQLPAISFDESNISVLEDKNGYQPFDAKQDEDQSVMADCIIQTVSELTRDTNTAVCACLSGGRKTMAFYLGFAMSLYGRTQDSLKHVFISPEYESLPAFFFPTKHDHWLINTEGAKVNAREAKVTLADIPFVRMHTSLASSMYSQIEARSFSKTVALINAANQDGPLAISINITARTVTILGVEIQLSPKLLALYAFIATQPNQKIKVGSAFIQSKEYTKQYLSLYKQMRGDTRVYSSFGLDGEIDWDNQVLDGLKPMSAKFIQEVLSQCQQKLSDKLPLSIVEKVKVQSSGMKGAMQYHIHPDIVIVGLEKYHDK